jgi:putative DNA primase/helicase
VRGDALSAAVRAVDLPALIAERYPESGAKPGKAGLYFAVWRGNTNTPAFSVSWKRDVWLWSDKATGEGGNAFDFLVRVVGMEKQEAAITLLETAGIAPDQPTRKSRDLGPRPIPAKASAAFGEAKPVGVPAMAKRGFTKAMIAEYGIIPAPDNPNDALIPITSPEGVVLQVKRRVHGATEAGEKYRYEHTGYGSPAWCSLGSRDAQTLYVVEGELNAMLCHAVMKRAGETGFGVIGVAGAKNKLYPGLCLNKSVFIYADDDEPGREARATWAEQAREDGARSVHQLAGQTLDFCDYAARNGRESLARLLAQLRETSSQTFGALDRMVGHLTVRQLAESAKRYIGGGVIHPTGFPEIDRETGGIRESGLFGIAALSSMGKSALLRRFAMEHLRNGGMVKLYSPDQSPHAVYRLTASLLSDVGIREARTRQFSRYALERHGSPEGCINAWQKMYEFVILELSKRFVISEEADLREISKDMERSVDQGFTMFGGDYLQAFEASDRNAEDGTVAKELQRLVGRLGVPFLAALQLAKSKFPQTRKSGIPFSSDILGSGTYFHASEMMFMIYNDSIYASKYAGPETTLLGDHMSNAHIYVRKDKEGEGDLDFVVEWVPRLVTYRDFGRRGQRYELEGFR